ncbi:hypothetical protein AQD72_26165 [Klebsiella pneumoniae]|nr:hypothetical protein AQD73_10705 [Klebsiella pneumoniae]AMY61244.1 hypothetical protein AQD68_28670 [Klebsiella pneumoniae]OJE57081.1 hypothetical protein AQD69_08040 [Klebsiella pneumoniae]OJE69143.1 hypothetical protein AQD70_14340 [Klebsiella pneumoniae]OJE75539.1 hypothetical protein AQD74_13680 [Klebsiella pneumoniae]
MFDNHHYAFLREDFLPLLAARSALILSSSAVALFSPLIRLGFSARHWAVSSPRNAFARIDWVRLLTRVKALLTCFSMVSA